MLQRTFNMHGACCIYAAGIRPGRRISRRTQTMEARRAVGGWRRRTCRRSLRIRLPSPCGRALPGDTSLHIFLPSPFRRRGYAAARVQYAWDMLRICCRDTAGPAHLEAHADDGSSKSRRGVEEEDLQALSARSRNSAIGIPSSGWTRLQRPSTPSTHGTRPSTPWTTENPSSWPIRSKREC